MKNITKHTSQSKTSFRNNKLYCFPKLLFPFNKLIVYSKAKILFFEIRKITKKRRLDFFIQDQLNRASLSIVLNIAEGSGRIRKLDQRRFFIISRGSVFECSSLVELMLEMDYLSPADYEKLNSRLEEISAMLYSLIRKME